MYQELRDAWRLERSSFRLQRVDKDLYEKLSDYLAKLSSSLEVKHGLAKRAASIELEVLKALAQDLFSLRVRKALIQALEGGDPSPYLAKEEAEAVSMALRALSEAEASLSQRFSVQIRRAELKLVRLLREVNEEVAPGLAPLKAESLALLPADLANKLIDEGYATAID